MATHRLPRDGYPAFNRYYGDAKTASALLSRLRIALGVRYPGVAFTFLAVAGGKLACGLGPWSAGVVRNPAFVFSVETGGSPSFPGDPVTALPCSQTPGGPPRQTIAAFRCCPRYHHNEGSPLLSNFEALSHGFTACCLRLKTPFLVANQGSLPVDGQSFPDGSVPAGSLQWLSVARFRFLLSVCCCLLASTLPASQGFGWRQMIDDF